MIVGQDWKAFLADMARPFSIYVSSAAASIATVRLAWMAHAGEIELNSAGFFIAAVWGGVCALYWGKAWEKNTEAKAAATVAVEQAKTLSTPAPGTANVQAAADVSVEVKSNEEPMAQTIDDPDRPS